MCKFLAWKSHSVFFPKQDHSVSAGLQDQAVFCSAREVPLRLRTGSPRIALWYTECSQLKGKGEALSDVPPFSWLPSLPVE